MWNYSIWEDFNYTNNLKMLNLQHHTLKMIKLINFEDKMNQFGALWIKNNLIIKALISQLYNFENF